MLSKKKLLEKSRLYLVFDKKVIGRRDFFQLAKSLTRSAAEIIQLRDKESRRGEILKEAFFLQKLLSYSKKIFIVNDYVEVAKLVNSDGLHLGQLDTSLQIARQILGKDKIIGVSCHNLGEALAAERGGADYIGLGPIFSTPAKPKIKPIGLKLVKVIKKRIKIPFFAIGGINKNNLEQLMRAGAKRVAICRAALQD